MKKRDKVDRIIGDFAFNFTHLWVDGFGWENTIFLPSDFDRIVKMPIKSEDGSQLFMAYNFDEQNQKTESLKFKGSDHANH